MRWYFALSGSSLNSDSPYVDCVRAAVESAKRNAPELKPTLIFDGEDCFFTRELVARGVDVIHHTGSLADAISAAWPDDMISQRIARGAYLRLDIPLIEAVEDYVLYTDCDVMFVAPPRLDYLKPAYFAVAPEFDHGNYTDMNSGVMVLNVQGLRAAYPELTAFIRQDIRRFDAFDQGALRTFFKGRYDFLPDAFNWKPYWGPARDSAIVHFHGPKPPQVRSMIEGCDRNPILWELYNRNVPAYQDLIGMWDRYLRMSHNQVGWSGPQPPCANVALNKPATQSSVSMWSTSPDPAVDAAGAVNGIIDGRQGFHTEIEDGPWWMVDLGKVHTIHQIRLHNRFDIPGVAERARNFAIEVGAASDQMHEIYRRGGQHSFGDEQDGPFVFGAKDGVPGRYVRIRLLEHNYLHLNEIEVLGI